MRVNFFLVISSTCVTYFWSNMAAPSSVITSAFQVLEQKIILQYGSDVSPLLKFHWPKYLPCSWKTWGLWAHRRAGEYDPTSEHLWWVTGATTLHSYPFPIWNQSVVPCPVLTVASVQFSSVTCRVWLFATPWITARQASLSIINSRSSFKLMSIESVMPSSHLILCCPLLLPPSIFPSIRVFSNESVLHIRCPKYWSFNFSISHSNE